MLQLAKKLVAQKDIGALADAFVLAAHQKMPACHFNVYFYDKRNSALCFLAGSSDPSKEWPVIHMDELDNPLIYAARSAKLCFVENIASLIDVGEGFERYRQFLPYNSALAVFPMWAEKNQLLGVLAVHGTSADVDAWGKDRETSLLRDIFISLFGLVLLYKNSAERLKEEQSYWNTQLADKVKEQAKRFVEMEFVGRSQVAQQVRSEVLNLADSSLSVLLTGETGTGKDYVAFLLHKISNRKGEFVAVNCAAIAKDLIESELFGCVKGAFTGAQDRQGLVATAHHGTLFLDEIGDMPLPLQASLLRLLNEKKYRPVGSNKEYISNFRLICATNKPLLKMVETSAFREDLYYRICQAQIQIAPLRERLVDVGALSRSFIDQYNLNHPHTIQGIDSDAIDILRQYPFMGNIRELKNIIFIACERTQALKMINKEMIQAVLPVRNKINLPLEFQVADLSDMKGMEKLYQTDNLPQALEELEQAVIRMRLKQLKGSKGLAAESLGIPQRTFARKCQHVSE
ncbi:MAG: sigma 54-interacting transcriptional regulator [Saezia sp.]